MKSFSIKRIASGLALSVVLLMLSIAPSTAVAQYTYDTVIVSGSKCPIGWTCLSFMDSSGETAQYAANFSRVAKTEAIAELKATLRRTLTEIVQKTIADHQFACNPGKPFEDYLASEVSRCTKAAIQALAIKAPGSLAATLGFGPAAVQASCYSGLRPRLTAVPDSETACSAFPFP